MSVAPGWYKDPAEPSTQRYWDGEGWVGEALPADATPPPGPPQVTLPAPTPPAPAPAPPSSPVPTTPAGPPAPHNGPLPPGTPTTQPWPPMAPPGYPYPPHGFRPPPPPPRPHGLRLASLGPRVVARLIDIGMVLLLNVVVNGWFAYRWYQETAPVRDWTRRLMSGEATWENMPQPGAQADGLQIAIIVIAVALWFAYEVPSTANTGQTLGKRIMRIKVVRTESTERMGFGRALRRWNILGLPTFLWSCCGIGLVLQFVDCVFPFFDRPLYQALHDKSAQTVVVEVPKTEAPPATDAPGGTK